MHCWNFNGMASNKESGIGSRVQNSPATHAYQKDICNRYTSRIHYPMTYSNYPFNVIWGIANVQRDVSYILSVTHSKAPIKEITGQTLWARIDRERSWSEPVICNSASVFRGRLWGRARGSAAGAQLLAWMGARRGEARRVSRATAQPSELTEITNCACPLGLWTVPSSIDAHFT